MLQLKAEFDRLRAVKGQKDPVGLNVRIKNIGEKPATATLLIKTPFSLGFDKIGLEREKRVRASEIKPDEEKSFSTHLYLKTSVKEGYIPMQIKLLEHPEGRFDKIDKEQMLELRLRVITP